MKVTIRPSLPPILRSHPHPTPRSLQKSIRRFATALQTLPSPSPYLPTYPDPSPSSIATSSAWTLDHPLWKLPASSADRKNVIAALIFASDEDLVSALLSSSRSQRTAREHYEEEWAASIDPGLAFLTLRSRPTYDLFLQNLRPHLRKLYTRLQSSDTHQLLVSDLLLRHPDPRILRDLLEIDTTVSSKRRLRSSLLISIFGHVAPAFALLAPLSRSTCIRLFKIVQSGQAISALAVLALFSQLKTTTDPHNADQIWLLLSLTLQILPSSPNTASTMLDQLITDGLVPHSPTFLQPTAEAIFIQATALRFALLNKLNIRAQGLTNSLLASMETTALSLEGCESVMESIRTSLASKDVIEASWASQMITRVCNHRDWPIVPSATIERALEGMLLKDRADWYAGLRNGGYDPPSAAFLLFMTTTGPNRTLWNKIIADLGSLSAEETVHVQADILCALLEAKKWPSAESLFAQWGSLQLSLKDVRKVVLAALESRRYKFGLAILGEWVDKRPILGSEHRLKLAELFLRLGDRPSARRQLACVDPKAPGVSPAVEELLQSGTLRPGARQLFEEMGLVNKAGQ